MWPFRKKSREVNEPIAPIEPAEPIESAAPFDPLDPRRAMRVMTVLSPQQQLEVGGIPAQAIAGFIDIDAPLEPGKPIPVTAFKPNPAFVEFMQHVIRSFGPDEPDLQEAARRQGAGSIGVIDLRTPEGVDGNVPLEDIVGIFAVADGKLGEYHANDKHVLFTRHGLVRLPPPLRDLHVRELMQLKCAK
jgi:hypothetical protein